jgi:osmotically-inducible protein OsmY
MSPTGQNPPSLAVAVMMLTLLTAWGLAVAPAHAARTVTDSDISSHIDQALLFDPAVPFDRIDVRTEDGVAILTGTVDNLLVRDRATRIAETVVGVRAVVNRIDVVPKTMYSGPKLEQRVNEALLYDPVAESYEVDVTADDEGRVTLKGSVDSWQERRLSGDVVKGVAGVTAVRNQIEVEAKADRPPDEIRPEIERRLHWDTLIHDRRIEVDVDGSEVTLSGTVGSAAEKRRAVSTAWISGVSAVDGSALEVENLPRDDFLRDSRQLDRSDPAIRDAVHKALGHDPRVSRFDIQVRVTNGIVTLTGVVDNAEARRAAERDAEHTVGVIGINNLIKLRPVPDLADTEIAERVKAALSRNPYVERGGIEVRVIAGQVYLEGTVDSYFDKAEAENAAFGVKGVTRVYNRLDVTSPQALIYDPYVYDWSIYDYPWYRGPLDVQSKTDLQIAREIEDQLFWSPFVDADEVSVTVEGGTATLTGTVDDWTEYDAARENAFEGGAITVVNRLQIE